MKKFIVCLSLVAVWPGLTRSAQAPVSPTGTIRGRVDVRRPSTQLERRPSVNDLGAPASRPSEQPRTVLYFESAPASAFADVEPQVAVMDQRNETFVPHVLAVRAGTTVEFPNSDPFYHNVFSISKARKFDLGHYPAGRSKSVRFDRPGIVRVFCEIHSHMSAFILVFSHAYFAVTSADGRYQIGSVPPGRYTLNAWNEGELRESRRIDVPDEGGALEVNFSLK